MQFTGLCSVTLDDVQKLFVKFQVVKPLTTTLGVEGGIIHFNNVDEAVNALVIVNNRFIKFVGY